MKLLNVANSSTVRVGNSGTINLNSIMNSVRVSKEKNTVIHHLAASQVESRSHYSLICFHSAYCTSTQYTVHSTQSKSNASLETFLVKSKSFIL